MTILEEIQNAAVDSKSDLGELLRKCKVLAARLGSQPLEDWLIWESNGYPEDIKVPDYRIWPIRVSGNFSGFGGVIMRNAPIPIASLKFIPEEIRELYENYPCRDSVAVVEATLRKVSGNVTVGTGDLQVAIGSKLYVGYNCIETWGEYGQAQLVELLNAVRNRILDFTLAVWKEAPAAGEIGSVAGTKPAPARVNQIFNTTIYGGSANIVGAATKSPISFNVGVKDFASLEKALVEKGVASTDIAELKEALESDPAPSTSQSFGPRVSTWMGKMVAKAAQGGWSIGAGAAGNLLAEVIAKYYGF
jgi:hypothetical protein